MADLEFEDLDEEVWSTQSESNMHHEGSIEWSADIVACRPLGYAASAAEYSI